MPMAAINLTPNFYSFESKLFWHRHFLRDLTLPSFIYIFGFVVKSFLCNTKDTDVLHTSWKNENSPNKAINK